MTPDERVEKAARAMLRCYYGDEEEFGQLWLDLARAALAAVEPELERQKWITSKERLFRWAAQSDARMWLVIAGMWVTFGAAAVAFSAVLWSIVG